MALAKRTIGMLSFPYTRVRQINGQERRSIAYALRGETVELQPEDVERGERLGAFDQPPPVPTTSEELAVVLEQNRSGAQPWIPSPAVPQEADLLPAEDRVPVAEELQDESAALVELAADANADEVIDLAGDDPQAAATLLDAERQRDNPRKTVVERLEKVANPA